MSERNGKSGATACDERNDEWNQKNAGISGEINVMRQFDSSPSSEKGDRTGETEKRGERWRGRDEVWKPRILSSSAVVRHREVIGSFEMLTSVIRRDRPMRGVSLKLEWIFNGKASH